MSSSGILLCSRREITIKMKPFLILLYGCEKWPMRMKNISKLSSLDHSCLKYVLCAHRADKILHDCILRSNTSINYHYRESPSLVRGCSSPPTIRAKFHSLSNSVLSGVKSEEGQSRYRYQDGQERV